MAALNTGKRSAAARVINDPGYFKFGNHTLPQPRRRAAAARWTCTASIVQVEQRLLLLAGQRDGRGPDARAAEAVRLRRSAPASTSTARSPACCRPPSGSARLQAARAAEVVRRRDHLAGHRPGLQQLHDAAAGQRHGHAGLRRPALQAAAGARGRGRRSRGQRTRVASDALEPLPLQARARGAHPQRDARRDAGRHLGARLRRRAPTPAAARPARRRPSASARNEKYNAAKLEEHQRDHSLYIACAPIDAPTVALAVVVENAGFGAAAAAPIARRVFDYLLLGQYPSEEDMAATREGKVGAPIGMPRRGGRHAAAGPVDGAGARPRPLRRPLAAAAVGACAPLAAAPVPAP